MQLLSHFMSNVENLHLSHSVIQSTVLAWFYLCVILLLSRMGYFKKGKDIYKAKVKAKE